MEAFSFRDYDALTRLRGAASINDKLRVALVSPSANKILADIPILGTQKVPIECYFGKPDCLGNIETLMASDYL